MDREQLALALQHLLDGQLSVEDFRAHWRDPMIGAPSFDRVWAHLEHYLDDRDIRERDARYQQMQDEALVELIARVRSAADTDALAQITFLEAVRPD